MKGNYARISIVRIIRRIQSPNKLSWPRDNKSQRKWLQLFDPKAMSPSSYLKLTGGAFESYS